MIHYFTVVMQKYAVFSGRARRAEYWYFVLATFVIGFAFGFTFSILGSVAGFSGRTISAGIELATGVIQLGLIIPSIAVGVRRLHDSNKSGWWLLVPVYNLYLLIRRGTEGDNFYGPDPKAPAVPLPDPVAMPTPPPAAPLA